MTSAAESSDTIKNDRTASRFMTAVNVASTHIVRPRWPRDLKFFALIAALWAAALTGKMVLRDVAEYSPLQLEAVLFGIKFDGYPAHLVVAAQAMAIFSLAIGLAAERRWGLLLAFGYLLQVVLSNLIFMMTYMGDIGQGSNVRGAGLAGIVAVLGLLYLWIRARSLLFVDAHA
jgi:hypothetical protein